MTNSKMRWMIAAFAVTAAAASASAQTYNAEIPLSFRAGNTKMAPGSYKVTMISQVSGFPLLRIGNLDTGSAVLVTTAAGDAPKWKNGDRAVLTFECVGGDCVLRQLSDGDQAFRIPVAHHAGELASIRILNVALKIR